jgi:hypothetical protein
MVAHVVLMVWLVQKGSAESKPLEGDPEEDADPRSRSNKKGALGAVRRGGRRLWARAFLGADLGVVVPPVARLAGVGCAHTASSRRRTVGGR